MRILHLIDSLNYGGAETLMMSYIPKLQDHHHTVVVLSGPNVYSRQGYKYIELDYKIPRNIYRAITTIKKIIKEERIEIVHSHSFWTNIISRLATPAEVKVFNHYHFADYDTLKKKKSVRLMVLFDKYVTHRNLQRIAVSKYLKNILQRIFIEEVVVVSNFILCPSISSKNKGHSDKLRIVSIGNLNFEKNHILIIEAFKELKNIPVEIDIIGGGDDLNLMRSNVGKLNLNVKFLGLVPNASGVLNDYDLYLSASLSETFGIAVLEGICAGLPLLLSDIPAHREIAPDGTEFFNPSNAVELVEKIKKIYNEKIVVDENLYKAVIEKYSINRFLNDVNYLYNSKTLEN